MSSCAASCAVDVRGSVCEAARLQRVVVSQCDAASATARAWAHGVRLLDLCVDAQLGTLLCAVCDFAGTRTLAICVPPLLEGAAVPLADDDAAVVDAHARLQHALHCAPGVFRLTLVRTCDGRAVVVDCDVAARVGDQPLRVDALRALRRDLVAGSYDPAAFVRSCVKRTVPALEGEQWRVSVADNAAPLVRLLRASGLNQRFFGLARHYLPRSTLTDLDAPLLLHCVTVVVKRALWQAWAALPRDGDAARFELAVREAAADVLNKYLLPWQTASTAQTDQRRRERRRGPHCVVAAHRARNTASRDTARRAGCPLWRRGARRRERRAHQQQRRQRRRQRQRRRRRRQRRRRQRQWQQQQQRQQQWQQQQQQQQSSD
jgi:hypothetical protein